MTSDDNSLFVGALLIFILFIIIIIATAALNEPYHKTISADFGGCNSPFGGVVIDRGTGCNYNINDCDLFNYIYHKEINVTIRKDIFTGVRTIIDSPGYIKPKQTQKECNC
jgi:hypothetical protein